MKQYFNSITAFMLAFIIAFTICFPIFTATKTKTVKADTLAWEKVGIPIFTFFVLAGKSARDQLANDLTQFGKDTSRGAKIWWDKLTGAQRDRIQRAYDNNSYIDITEYKGIGFEDIPSYTNKVEYSPPVGSIFPTMSDVAFKNANDSFRDFSNATGKSVTVSFVKEDATSLFRSYNFIWNGKTFLFTRTKDSFTFDGKSTYSYSDYAIPFCDDILGLERRRFPSVFPSLYSLTGNYNFSYSPTAEVPTSLDFGQLKAIGNDVSSIKNMYDSTSKTVVDMSSILNKVDSNTGALVDSSQANLEEVKKSNGFLGTIKDYLTITLPKTLSNIGADVKAIPSTVATSISNLFVVEDTYFKSKFLEYEKVLKNKYPSLDFGFMKIKPSPPEDIYITVFGARSCIVNFSDTASSEKIISFIRIVFNAIVVFLLIVFNYSQIVSLIRGTSPLTSSSSAPQGAPVGAPLVAPSSTSSNPTGRGFKTGSFRNS